MPTLKEHFGKAFLAHPLNFTPDEFGLGVECAGLEFELGVLESDDFGKPVEGVCVEAVVVEALPMWEIFSKSLYSEFNVHEKGVEFPPRNRLAGFNDLLIDEARHEMQRTLDALAPFVKRGVPVIGLEPSCLFTFRDEMPAVLKAEGVEALAANSLLLEEFIAREQKAGTLELPLGPLSKKALLHGHCHQKSFAAMGAVEGALKLIPELAVETVESSCCGMAGSFGYDAKTIDVSLKMGELSLLPAVRKAADDTLIVADGTSCRHQIHDGAERDALHVARVLAMSVEAAGQGR